MAHPWRGVGGTRSFLLWRLVERNLVKKICFLRDGPLAAGRPAARCCCHSSRVRKDLSGHVARGLGAACLVLPSGRDLAQKYFFASFLVISAVEASALSILMSYACWGLRNLQEMGAKLPARGQGGSSRSPRSSSFWYVEREAKHTFA